MITTRPPCKHCQSPRTKIKERGDTSHGYRIRYFCNSCRRSFTVFQNGRTGDDPAFLDAPSFEEMGNEATATLPREKEPPTLESLFEKFKLNPEDWKVLSFKINEWQQHSVKLGTVSLYQGKATLLRNRPAVCEWPTVRPLQLQPLKAARGSAAAGPLKRAVVVADAQVGFLRDFDTYRVSSMHDLRAFAIVTGAIRQMKPDTLVLLGDMLDLPDWSTHFVQSPECAFSTQMSLNWLANWIRQVRPYCGRAVYIEGNHEGRLARNIITNTRSAYKLRPANLPEAPPALSIENLLGPRDLDVEYIGPYPRGEYWLNDNLRLIHGEKVGAKSGQTAMKMLDGIRSSTMQGHCHRQEQAHVTVRGQGKTVTYGAYGLGTLSRLDGKVPGSDGRDNWQQGFAVIDYTDDLFQVYPINIYGGRSVMFGRRYEATGVTNDPLTEDEVQKIKSGAEVPVAV